MRKARGMSDVFSLQLCPPIGQNNSRENKEQGGQLVSVCVCGGGGGGGGGVIKQGAISRSVIFIVIIPLRI